MLFLLQGRRYTWPGTLVMSVNQSSRPDKWPSSYLGKRSTLGNNTGGKNCCWPPGLYFSDLITIFIFPCPGWSQRSWWICWIKTGHRCVTLNLPWSWTRVSRDISLTSPWSLTASDLQQSWLPWRQSRWGTWTARNPLYNLLFLLAELSEWKFEMSW